MTVVTRPSGWSGASAIAGLAAWATGLGAACGAVCVPAVVGKQRALEMFYTGRRLKGEEALAIGLCDELVDLSDVRSAAHARALEIARSAPLAIESIRATMRGDLPVLIRKATDREKTVQDRLRQTEDFREGVALWLRSPRIYRPLSGMWGDV